MNSPHLSPAPTDAGEGRAAAIRRLNDALRRTWSGGRVVLTAGVAALADSVRAEALAAVQTFERFDADNDPHGEHDFGSIEVGGLRLFWKIDAYDRALEFVSPDPADPAVTLRVLTILRSEEY